MFMWGEKFCGNIDWKVVVGNYLVFMESVEIRHLECHQLLLTSEWAICVGTFSLVILNFSYFWVIKRGISIWVSWKQNGNFLKFYNLHTNEYHSHSYYFSKFLLLMAGTLLGSLYGAELCKTSLPFFSTVES